MFEIDPRRQAFLQDAARDIDVAVEIVGHDLREPFAEQFLGAFDCFQTDPPYTIAGATLFVRRGVELLDRGRGYGMLSFGHTSPPDRLKLQAALTSLGVATTALYPAFNRYAGASILGSTSELHELVATGAMTAGEAAQSAWAGPLYTAEVNPRDPHLRLHAVQSPLATRNGFHSADHRGAEGNRLPRLRQSRFSPRAQALGLCRYFGCHHRPAMTTPSEAILRSPIRCSPTTST